MSRKILGIDIRNDSIAAVLVISSMRENRIDASAEVPIPAATEEQPNGIAAALESLKETMDISGCDCVVSVPSERFSYRNIKVPFSNPKKIRMVLPFELEPTLPYQIDNLVLDFQTIDTAESEDTTTLIAAAIEQPELDPYIEALAAMKIDPECLTISGLPAALCLANHAEADEDQLFADINKKSCTLYATVGGQIQVIRSFGLPQSETSRPQVLITQIKRTLAAFDEMDLSEFQPLDIIISGDGLDSEGLREDIVGALNMEVKAANLADRLNIPIETHAADAWKPTHLDDALALALLEIENLEGLNFHKGQFAVQKFLAKNKPQVIKTAILAAAILALLAFNVAVDFYTVHRRIAGLNHQMEEVYKATFPEIKTIKYPYEDMKAKVTDARRKSVFRSDTVPHVRSIDILNDISRRIPKDIAVDITRLVVGSGNVLISGNTDTFDSLEDIKGGLEQIEFFKKVTQPSANRDRSGKEIRFVLKAEL
jgi:type II secretion system protein L